MLCHGFFVDALDVACVHTALTGSCEIQGFKTHTQTLGYFYIGCSVEDLRVNRLHTDHERIGVANAFKCLLIVKTVIADLG